MIKFKKLKISSKQAVNLPVFYNHVVYNKFLEASGPDKCTFSDKLNCYTDHTLPEKMISKIIDYSKI
ncbi:hypothetical protein DXN05_19200 [Deminuibacter soli]|uniref:Uncharacterized protein n=1 Tax=Deminuibacter soli TaxID=2291815 RepID=A0A3E1NFE0_9BACT|nr:hypothetical protein DXN05_19200 [Deminuibacter soli]